MTYIYHNENGYGYVQPKFNLYGGGYYLVNESIENELILALPYILPTIENDIVVSFAKTEPPKPDINAVKNNKVNLFRELCRLDIVNGLDITLSDKSVKHFSYDTEDQQNIAEMINAVKMGATAYPYHADGEDCIAYSAQDISIIYFALAMNKTKSTTYYNQMKQYIESLTDIDAIQTINYGDELTGEYLTKYNDMIKLANDQISGIMK